MGELVDRESEHLAPSDIMITRVRRQLLDLVTRYRESGALPATASGAELYGRVRGGHFLALRDTDWRQAYAEAMAAAPWESVGKQAGR